MKVNIKKISLAFEDIAAALPMATVLPMDRERIRSDMADIRRFFSACEMNRDEIESILKWHNVMRPTKREAAE